MAIVRRENRQLTVQDDVVASYLIEGYDQIDVDGNIVKRATGGRMIPLAEFNKVIDENEKLQAIVKDLKEEKEVLEADNERLTRQLRGNQQQHKK